MAKTPVQTLLSFEIKFYLFKEDSGMKTEKNRTKYMCYTKRFPFPLFGSKALESMYQLNYLNELGVEISCSSKGVRNSCSGGSVQKLLLGVHVVVVRGVHKSMASS